MDFQRSRSRRRRVFREETGQVASQTTGPAQTMTDPSAGSASASQSKNYTRFARRRYQLKTCDLIPKRMWVFGLVWLAFLAVTASLTALHYWAAAVSDTALNARQITDWLTIGRRGSLGLWLSNVLLLMSALVAVQIYWMRRHHCDDYRGSYRLWLWLAGIAVIASSFCVTSVEPWGTLVIALLPAWPIFQPDSLLWLVLPATLVLAAATRLIFEVRRSIASSICLLFAAIALWLTLASTWRHEWAMASLADYRLWLESASLWSATWLTLAVITFARFVYLDAHTLIESPESNSSRTSFWSKFRRNTSNRDERVESEAEDQPAASSSPRRSQRSQSKRSQSTGTPSTGTQSTRAQSTGTATASRSSQGKSKAGSSKRNRDDADRTPTQDDRPPLSLSEMSESDRRLLQTGDTELDQLSKSDRRRLRKLQKRHKMAA